MEQLCREQCSLRHLLSRSKCLSVARYTAAQSQWPMGAILKLKGKSHRVGRTAYNNILVVSYACSEWHWTINYFASRSTSRKIGAVFILYTVLFNTGTGLFAPTNIRSLEWKFQLWNNRSLERLLPPTAQNRQRAVTRTPNLVNTLWIVLTLCNTVHIKA